MLREPKASISKIQTIIREIKARIQNTFTGRLTEGMLDAVMNRVCVIIDEAIRA